MHNLLRKIGLGLILTITGSGLAFSQSDLLPQKVTIFKDAAQLSLKGVLRFKNRICKTTPGFDFIPESIEASHAEDFSIQYVKFTHDTIMERVAPTSWADILKANIGKFVAITYQIGTEVDELSGKVKQLDEKSGFFLLQDRSNNTFFLPLDQVRQVMVDTLGNWSLKKGKTYPMLEFMINQDLPFAPLEVTGLVTGFNWSPSCKLILSADQTALYQFNAMIQNTAGNLENVLMELSGNSILDSEGSSGSLNDEIYSVGKLSMKKGEEMFVKLVETRHEYSPVQTCEIPWEGPGSVVPSEPVDVQAYLRFTNPINASLSCKTVNILGEDQKAITQVSLDKLPPGGIKEIPLGSEPRIRVVYAEKEIKRAAKATKIGDKNYIKAYFEGVITVVNTTNDAINVRVTRGIFGTVTEGGGATVVQDEKEPTDWKMHWSVPLKTSSSKKLIYKFEAWLPEEG
ncbi:MAG: hypothetical protein H6581_31310 [Bacteroidia bacterium]|nr:hypothetical protein [Bacteroidia bacterium]